MANKSQHSLFRMAMTSPWWMLLSVVLSVISSVAMFVPYISIFMIVQEVIANSGDITMFSIERIGRYGLAAFLSAAVNVVCYFGALSASHLGAFDMGRRLRNNMAEHIYKIPLGKHIAIGSGKMHRLINDNIAEIESYFAHQVPEYIIAFLSPIFLLGIMLYINVWYTLALCIGVLGSYYFNSKSFSYAAGGGKKMMDIYLTALENLNNESNEFVRGISVIKVFGQRNRAIQRLVDSIKLYSDTCVPYTLVWEKFSCVFSGLMSNLYLILLPVAMILIGVKGLSAYSAADFVAFLLLTPSFAIVIPNIQGISHQSVEIQMAIDRMEKVLDIEEVDETEDFSDKCVSNSVEFKNVTFTYDGAYKAAVENVSFIANEDTVTGVVGLSGSGKSTLAYLVARFWDVDQGCIAIGDVDIRKMKLSSLMEKVSFVFQDAFIFDQTVAENIRGGKYDISMNEIIAAAKAARCHDFISAMPQGYDTVIENGQKLSGGEKQRISIARAIIKNTPIIVLDEATASTDLENEHEIQLAINELSKNKTVIMIAHRLSNVKKADNIILMENGGIAEQGTHQELIANGGKYKAMWDVYQENINWRF